MNKTLRSQIIAACLLMGTFPALAIGIVAWSASGNLGQIKVDNYQLASQPF